MEGAKEPTRASVPGVQSFGARVAVVTGAGTGIGRAAAIQLARRGANVGVLSHDEGNVRETVASIEGAGGEALALVADVRSEAALTAAYGEVERRWGRLDMVVANAGINGVHAPLDELTLAEWEHTLATNLTGTFLTVKLALPLLRRRGGAVVVTASVNGTRTFSNTGATAYSCSKAGQVAFAKMTALELARDRIRVNVICPGAITTAIDDNTERRNIERVRIPVEFPQGNHPLAGGPGTPDQVARLIAFLLSDDADHITGTEVWIDGGESLLIG
ncbi:MAG: SDR family oxidoreductase [Chloroflexia bacterium]|nr:SDR family oxidoreductase [Chloroflexia bacterium]